MAPVLEVCQAVGSPCGVMISMHNSQAAQGPRQGVELGAFDDAVNHVFRHPSSRTLHALGNIPGLVALIVGVVGYSPENCRVSYQLPEHGAHHHLNLVGDFRPCFFEIECDTIAFDQEYV